MPGSCQWIFPFPQRVKERDAPELGQNTNLLVPATVVAVGAGTVATVTDVTPSGSVPVPESAVFTHPEALLSKVGKIAMNIITWG